ncbi:hypothetical protein COO60DRAFT_32613 [Scenedesmus sp. NREL 46B-D3]|nr:hypothetical protein COO60DRAFT_32613 [Scenedesmus sp. NREL 46B-D3]
MANSASSSKQHVILHEVAHSSRLIIYTMLRVHDGEPCRDLGFLAGLPVQGGARETAAAAGAHARAAAGPQQQLRLHRRAPGGHGLAHRGPAPAHAQGGAAAAAAAGGLRQQLQRGTRLQVGSMQHPYLASYVAAAASRKGAGRRQVQGRQLVGRRQQGSCEA